MIEQLKEVRSKLIAEKELTEKRIIAVDEAIATFRNEPEIPKHKKIGRPKGSFKKRAEHIEDAGKTEYANGNMSIAQKIKSALKDKAGQTIEQIEAGDLFGINHLSLKSTIHKLYAKGEIKRVGRGVYALATNGAKEAVPA